MSELEDLADIAEQTAFGTGRMADNHHHHRPAIERHARCCSPDHMKGANIRVYAVKGKKTRAVCKLCDKARRSARAARPHYNMQGYPL